LLTDLHGAGGENSTVLLVEICQWVKNVLFDYPALISMSTMELCFGSCWEGESACNPDTACFWKSGYNPSFLQEKMGW